ncbi:MAG: hypothetical protein ROZ09_11550 [Thiobacillus sp.]|jgi:hypothetical protein|uniref:hypothetical protein n=1 Tax=Thiobacillus sp. TaxID=924 RepID=UPI002894D5D6|nr:hypothetical protein [Thiobacillus sp.]MDT3707454.1 hypothetical protein [Thiobacillus sp.]
MSIEDAKRSAGWQHPNSRRGCLSCRHGYQEAHGVGFCPPSWRCSQHGWFTHRHAICDAWAERKGVRG